MDLKTNGNRQNSQIIQNQNTFFFNLIILVKMNNREQEIFSKLKDAGMNVDYYHEKPDCFNKCPICGDQISEENQPALLYCGHILCVRCIVEDDIRNCGPCNKQALEKVMPFPLLLELFKEQKKPIPDTPLQEETKYHYSIRSMNSSSVQMIQNCPGTMTIETILQKSKDFQRFLGTVGDRTGLIICSKNVIFSRIKNKTMEQLSKEKDFQLKSSATKQANDIVFFNYWKGGQ